MSSAARAGGKPKSKAAAAKARAKVENHFVASSRGDLPLVICMPHGGALRPEFIPDQTTSIRKADSHTKLLGSCIARGVKKRLGESPFTVACCVHRSKVDVNRPLKSEFLGTTACSDPMGILIWHEYHNAIALALEECLRRFGSCLLIDLHGQAHGNDYVELGYSLTRADLVRADRYLDTQQCTVNTLGASVSEVVRGPYSLGAYLHAAEVKACPSPALPRPPGKGVFFEGGYTAWHYAGMKFDGNPGFNRPGVATIQCETPYVSRQSPKSSPPFDGYGGQFAAGLSAFLQHWYSRNNLSLGKDASRVVSPWGLSGRVSPGERPHKPDLGPIKASTSSSSSTSPTIDDKQSPRETKTLRRSSSFPALPKAASTAIFHSTDDEAIHLVTKPLELKNSRTVSRLATKRPDSRTGSRASSTTTSPSKSFRASACPVVSSAVRRAVVTLAMNNGTKPVVSANKSMEPLTISGSPRTSSSVSPLSTSTSSRSR
eukprot:gb/GEZN01006552.1/.p1 GENE.gb/GEZN01006552.1/~~gb/GEZN01006552.1/.p1  ORF type:complete len:488 (-),score=29.05 gb/GEZN01006552.1/:172-1635(-)